ncbi:uncharacterized protein LOC130612257 [Hydractinia symbiolongicarpus]|uniref:uncharacterized protein LOC130612257 n=1 Tax=Hydractinia symbiolongicarpus TaxID=13093 RepID=UPI00255189F2|nr:uncharacterized protein LOC130612257 [Hydractinia symbiolongicarpus]
MGYLSTKNKVGMIILHLLQTAYICVISWRMKVNLDKFKDDWTESEKYGLSISLPILHGAGTTIWGWYALWGKSKHYPTSDRFHAPVLLLTTFGAVLYGPLLHHVYRYEVERLDKVSSTRNFTSCLDLKVNKLDFGVIQAGMILVCFTLALYPLCKPEKTKDQTRCFLSMTATEFFEKLMKCVNAMDMIELVEDLGCIQRSDGMWVVLFYLALLISTLLLAFPEALNIDKDTENKWWEWLKVFTTFLTWVFTDICFVAIRLHVMVKEDNIQTGFSFVVKNLLFVVIHFLLLLYQICQICSIKSKRNQSWEEKLAKL